MTPGPENIDWSLCTPEAQDREQLRRWIALPLLAKLEALEEMCDHSRATIASLQRRGLPYIDPFTGEGVRGARKELTERSLLPSSPSDSVEHRGAPPPPSTSA